MTQKDKVKELVGRGLHSYHTKSLQQMDRIEKKNKEQNHKISILSKELDNDYLTKTEEGSVISLEHSKEGMVYLDELQGNTLVNYCTDGSKELTLNGDIDVEGTFVTTTEGVDNGKVDVMCEGCTLVNILKTNGNWFDEETTLKTDSNIAVGLSHYLKSFDIKLLKSNTLYTVIPYVDYSIVTKGEVYIQLNTEINNVQNSIFRIYETSFNKPTLITTSNLTNLNARSLFIGGLKCEYKFRSVKILILEGDWTNKEIPPYFEGMKSVGQDDENGHKIEILSQNKNLIDLNRFKASSDKGTISIDGDIITFNYKGSYPTLRHTFTQKEIDLLKGKTFKFGHSGITDTVKNNNLNIRFVAVIDGVNKYFTFPYTTNYINTVTLPNNIQTLEFSVLPNNTNDTSIQGTFTISKMQLVFADTENTNYVKHSLNKKEILLNEPLRKINANYMDKVVKISNKFYKEKNCEEILSTDFTWSTSASNTFETCKVYAVNIPNLKAFDAIGVVCDKLPVYSAGTLLSNNPQIAIALRRGANTGLLIRLPIDTDITTYINENPFNVIVPLLNPQYEEVNNFELLTYNDITHISNNSMIPCNMKVQNTGYNAIIKPSTLYTISLDTNNSGTIGMNLGGTKGTTTNNVLKLTTPATLTDDSLRLYGKGIKGSKVRLLEGDKTNWIPSFFEGMKSSFEDKFDTTDNTYKMEILSNNRNLINFKGKITTNGKVSYNIDDKGCNISASSAENGLWQNIGIPIKVCNNKTYVLSYEDITYNSNDSVTVDKNSFVNIYEGKPNRKIGNVNFETKKGVITIPKGVNTEDLRIRVHITQGDSDSATINIKGLMLTESNDKLEFVSPEYNKIQFSSIEPSRGVGDVKDKFVFKDGKLMVQRNIGKYFITKDSINSYGRTNSSIIRVNFNAPNFDTNGVGKIKVLADKYPSGVNDNLHGSYFNNIIGITGDKYMRIILTNLELGILSTTTPTIEHINAWLDRIGGFTVTYQLAEPTYEEIPFELQKIILEGYENGTLFFDTNIPPTSTITYAGETPIVKATKLNKTEVLNNTNDINDNIIPYLMDMDYRVVCLQLQSEGFNGGIEMARLFGGTYEMLKRDILSKRLTKEEYGYRLTDYFNAGKLTEQEVRELEDLK